VVASSFNWTKPVGLVNYFGRKWKHAGAQIAVSCYVSETLEIDTDFETTKTVFFLRTSALKLENGANRARRFFLAELRNATPEHRKKIHLPGDYWKLAVHTIVDSHIKRLTDKTTDLDDLIRDCVFLVGGSAFQLFENEDAVSIVIVKDGRVVVNKLQNRPVWDYQTVLLGTLPVTK